MALISFRVVTPAARPEAYVAQETVEGLVATVDTALP
jgi:hypothetical protein